MSPVVVAVRRGLPGAGSRVVVQSGIDGRPTQRTHRLIVAESGQVRESQRERPATCAHPRVVVDRVEYLRVLMRRKVDRADGGSHIQMTDRSVAGSPAARSPKSMTAERRPPLSSRLPG